MTKSMMLGVHHVGLSVLDLVAARRFFVEALDYEIVGENPDYPASFVSDGTTMLTLWQVADPVKAMPFDHRANVGLHHLALKVADRAILATAYERVKAYPGVRVEYAPGPMRQGATMHHCIVAIPGGIRLEIATAT